MTKPRRMRWTGHVARMGGTRNTYKVLVGKSEGKIPLEHADEIGKIIIKWILEK
jgi:hypothetical protein